jgi:hypothetical protein
MPVLLNAVLVAAVLGASDPEPRLTGNISLVGGAAFASSGFVPGPGFAGELGVRFDDRWALTASLELFGLVVWMNGQAGLHATFAASPRVSLGMGVRVSQILVLAFDAGSPSTALLAPVRLLIALSDPVNEVRHGWVLIFDVAPGVQVGGTFYGRSPAFAGSATVGLGWSAW